MVVSTQHEIGSVICSMPTGHKGQAEFEHEKSSSFFFKEVTVDLQFHLASAVKRGDR